MTNRDLLAAIMVGGITAIVTILIDPENLVIESGTIAGALWLMYRVGKSSNGSG